MEKVELRTLKNGDIFKRKPDSRNIFSRQHYNRPSDFWPASFTCSDYYDIGRSIYLNGSTQVYVGFDF